MNTHVKRLAEVKGKATLRIRCDVLSSNLFAEIFRNMTIVNNNLIIFGKGKGKVHHKTGHDDPEG
jgi:hypothetical protein